MNGASAPAPATDVVHRITADDLPAVVAGHALLSSGGGGIDGLTLSVAELLRRHGPVELVPLDALPPETHCAAVGLAGGFAPLLELPPGGDESVLAVRALEERTGNRLGAVVALNSAGPNALFPIAAAASLGLPLVDCDGMGRILPLINMTTYALGGLSATPLAAVSQSGDTAVLDCSTARSDRLLRGIVEASGGAMLCALYPTTVGRLRGVAIEGATSRVMRVGELLTGENRHAALLAGLARTVGARVLASGQVTALDLPTPSAGARHFPSVPTSIVVSDPSGDGPVVRLEAQNEILLALIDGAVTAAVPDVLCLLDRQRLQPVSLENVALADHVDVLVVPAAPMWHTPQGLAMAGPRAFGFPVRHPGEEVPR
ncbi:DUF917 domain-containing protein [Streptomyces sp. XM4193]|uniref:DUF917 domain-containing protein n=1 Tax=Streptomyces sp. XM4193 TaxID=2929782 RepID=UPI001FF730FD|nr:DUF917 domain-containing protein [Streptomyces sp. XM4193]MCK1797348.1 DUF917 domain-containing protein [Streptomyces sp. XM4193]